MGDDDTRKFNDVQKVDWGRFLADTMHLTQAQMGAYVLLLAHYWITAKAIPDDDTRLRMITRTKEADWARTKGVLAEFFEVRNQHWFHKRVEADLKHAKEEWDRRHAQTVAAREAKAVSTNVTKPLTEVDKVMRHKEYDRVCEKMTSISRQYAQHQTWTDGDVKEYKALRERKKELADMLGLKA